MVYKHKLDKDGLAQKIGDVGEEDFFNFLVSKGYNPVHSSLKDDKYGHFDYFACKIDENTYERLSPNYKIEVKGMKKLNRNDKLPMSDMLWIELWEKGWILGAHSDLIAFQFPDRFIVVKTKDMKDFVNNIISNNSFEEGKGLWKIYRRKNDWRDVMLIPRKILEQIEVKL